MFMSSLLCFCVPRLILRLFEQKRLIILAQGVLPGIEVVLEAPHGHLAASPGGGRVHKAALARHQGAQHPGAQRQQHHREKAHRAGHGNYLSRVAGKALPLQKLVLKKLQRQGSISASHKSQAI